jgi:SAM-dependent methyltransferase
MTATDILSSPTPTDEQFDAIKGRQNTAWASGDYAVIGSSLQITGERLCEDLDLSAGWRVLDVAAGNGNASLAAARRNANVTATDYVPALLEKAAQRAAADGLVLTTREADAEALPFADRTFDAVVSVFGVMFTPRQERAAAELVRVCRPGGRIGLANWTPDSFVAEIFKTIARHVAPPPVPSVFRWGTSGEVELLLGGQVELASVSSQEFVFWYLSPAHFVNTFRSYYGPTNRAFAALDAEQQDALEHDLLTLARRSNQSSTGAFAASSQYLQVIATRL